MGTSSNDMLKTYNYIIPIALNYSEWSHVHIYSWQSMLWWFALAHRKRLQLQSMIDEEAAFSCRLWALMVHVYLTIDMCEHAGIFAQDMSKSFYSISMQMEIITETYILVFRSMEFPCSIQMQITFHISISRWPARASLAIESRRERKRSCT